jgi:hypothetical protein
MKKLTIFLLTIFSIVLFPFLTMANANIPLKTNKQMIKNEDTISFTLHWNFNGDCAGDYYKFLGTGIIKTVNNVPISETCNHVFIKCPVDINLQKGIEYRFVAVPFSPTNCSTSIDTCYVNKTYLIIKQLD